MNKYVKSLREMKAKSTHQLKEVGDQWRTPDSIFWGINAMFGPLVLDLFTDGENSKCSAFYTAEDNALTQDWAARLNALNGAAFANPPYSRAKEYNGQYITGMKQIIGYTEKMRERGGRYVLFIKSATSEAWWPENADHIAFVRGRIAYDLPNWFIPENKSQSASAASFSCAIALFDKKWCGERFSYISRANLEAQGTALLAQKK